MISVYITCKNKREAKKIGFYLVQKRLAACCNIIPQIDSIYWWSSFAPASAKASAGKKAMEDKPPKSSSRIIRDKEAVLIVHTLKKNFKKIEKGVKRLHGYTVPLISEIPVKKVNREYLNWLKKEVK